MDLAKYKNVFEELINDGLSIDEIALQLGCETSEIETVLASNVEINIEEIKPIEESKKSRIDIMRQRYLKLFEELPLSYEDLMNDPDYVSKVVDEIKSLYDELKSISDTRERGINLVGIANNIKKLTSYEVPIETCDYLNGIFQDDEITCLSGIIFFRKRGAVYIRDARNNIDTIRCKNLLKMAANTTDVEELDKIVSSFKNFSGTRNTFIYSMRSQVEKRRTDLKVAKISRNLRYNIGQETDSVARKIASGTITKEEFEQYLEGEAKRKMSSISSFGAPKNLDSYKKQALIQLRTILGERGELYRIKNPNEFRSFYLKYLDSTSQGESGYINIIVSNMLKNKEYDKAREFCKQYTRRREDSEEFYQLFKYARGAEKRITYAEIGNLILSKLKNRISAEDDEIFLTSLISRLRQNEGVSPAYIKLGKNKYGTRDITLLDIWDNEKERNNFTTEVLGKKGASK